MKYDQGHRWRTNGIESNKHIFLEFDWDLIRPTWLMVILSCPRCRQMIT